MNKNLTFLNFADDDERRIVLSALELAERSKNQDAVISSFLNMREQKLVKTALLSDGSFCFTFFGGYRDAERAVLLCFPEYLAYSMMLEPGYIELNGDELFSYCRENTRDLVSLVHISCSDFVKLTHRDYMGAILALGIERSTIGDIIVNSEHDAFVFLLSKIADYVCFNLQTVGRTPVKAVICNDYSGLKIKQNTTESSYVATSLRFDCVVSSITGISRDKSKTMIKQGLCELNYYSKASPDDSVTDGDIISVRGYGKYRIADTSGVTSKGKSRITVLKYI